VAADLDQTLIYSLRAAGPRSEADVDGLDCVEHYEGRPLSFVTRRGAGLLAELSAAAVFVPATTRTRAQLARVRLPGPPPAYSVAANGGFVLVDGRPDLSWTRALTAALAVNCATLDEVRGHLTDVLREEFTTAVRCAEDLFLYAVVIRERVPEGVVDALHAWAGPRGWGVSLQGRKLYLVPHGLTKSAAVREVARRTDAVAVLAAGDSLLDRGLLEGADAAVRPAHGELHAQGWAPPHVAVTRSSGPAAGEEILDWLLGRVVPEGPG
jgi:hypothetical protein